MIVERHYDDETLIALLGASGDAQRDPHLAVCSSCSESLASYRAIAEVLGQEAAWDLCDLRHEPVPETITSLRSFSSALTSDDRAAEELVQSLLASPPDRWTVVVTSDLRYLSAPVLRALVAASDRALGPDPSRSLAVAQVAARIASLIAGDETSGGAVTRACGAAWRQYAYAAFYVGDYNRTAEGVQRSRDAFGKCVVSDYDLARVDIVHSLWLSVNERHGESIEVAKRAALVFEAFGDRQRLASARTAVANALMCQMRHAEALPILQGVASDFSTDIDNDTRARVLANLALCQIELKRHSDGLSNYQVAAAIYDELGNVSEAARIRYHIAGLLAVEGRLVEAKNRLRTVRSDFQRLGMADLAVAAGLELAEILLAEKAFAEAEELCMAAIREFERTGLAASTNGMAALAYLQEAATQKTATPQAARHVRRYLGRLPQEPELVFVPLPLPPG
jgi:tetratricopeptide (TPR) repeat protein